MIEMLLKGCLDYFFVYEKDKCYIGMFCFFDIFLGGEMIVSFLCNNLIN